MCYSFSNEFRTDITSSISSYRWFSNIYFYRLSTEKYVANLFVCIFIIIAKTVFANATKIGKYANQFFSNSNKFYLYFHMSLQNSDIS